jgi:hypothetical protein
MYVPSYSLKWWGLKMKNTFVLAFLFGLILVGCDTGTGTGTGTGNGDGNENFGNYNLVIRNRTSVYKVIDLELKDKDKNQNYASKTLFQNPWVDIEPGEDLKIWSMSMFPQTNVVGASSQVHFTLRMQLVEGRINPFWLTGDFTFEKGKTTLVVINETGTNWGTITNQ